MPDDEADLEDLRRVLRGRAVQETFIHLAYYLDEPPGQSLALGLALTTAAHRSRPAEA